MPNGAERTAHLAGRSFDVKEGERVTVAGRLRVTDWPPWNVGEVLVLGWTGIVVDEGER